MKLTVGVVSDTHGLLRPAAVAALQGVDLIIHAGDVGSPDVLEMLRNIAPVFPVRGNVDTTSWALSLPQTDIVACGPHSVYVLHDLAQLDVDPAATEMRAVISGHTHQPNIEERGGVLFLNPGSIGPRRFNLPVSLAKLHVDGDNVEPELIELDV